MLDENNELKNQMALERYKFILDKIKFLDTTYNTNFNHVSKIITAIIGFIIAVSMAGIENKIGVETVTVAIKLGALLGGVSALFFSVLSISTVFSWFDYRKEEVKLHSELNISIGRNNPDWEGLIRWHETHVILLLLTCSGLSFWLFYKANLIVSMLNIST